MITFNEILHKIASDILNDPSGLRYDVNMCITDNSQQAEKDFIEKYGAGKSYNFHIDSYEHGKQLAVGIYRALSGNKTEVPGTGMSGSSEQTNLSLFIHLSPVKSA